GKAMKSLKKISEIGLQNFTASIDPNSSFTYKVFKYYNPSLTRFTMIVINRATGEQYGDGKEVFDIAFLKGRKPSRILKNFGTVDYQESPVRVTKRSFTLLPV